MSSCGRRGVQTRRGHSVRINRYNPNDPDYKSVHFQSPFSSPFIATGAMAAAGIGGLIGLISMRKRGFRHR